MQNIAPTNSAAATSTPGTTPGGLPAYARPTSGMNPPHSKTESTLAPTSEFTRLFLLAWVVRYIPRGIAKFFFDARTLDRIKTPVNALLKGPTDKRVQSILDTIEKFKDHPEMKTFLEEVAKIKPGHEVSEQGAKEVRDQLLKALKPLQETSTKNRDFYDPKKSFGKLWSSQSTDNAGLYDKLYQELRKGTFRSVRGNSSVEVPEALLGLRYNEAKGLTVSEDYFGRVRNMIRGTWDDMVYSGMLGIGSSLLSLRYSMMVRNDIKSLFSEVVSYEKGVPPDQVTFSDISASENNIIKQTVHNYWSKLGQRLATDALFFVAIPFKSDAAADVMLGVKGVQMFGETWKRKATLFEDITNFVNNKINPRNGLGQPVTVGEVFDLYQHYTEQFDQSKMFTNVVERGTGEGALWANNQPIFQRIAELMNLTYSYKHPSLLDAQGNTIHQANFPLPKLIYLLGHNMIDTRQPELTMAYIEVANRHGMEAVKEMYQLVQSGAPLQTVIEKYPVRSEEKATAHTPVIEAPNSITKVNHADAAIPATTLDAGTLSVLDRAEAAEQQLSN